MATSGDKVLIGGGPMIFTFYKARGPGGGQKAWLKTTSSTWPRSLEAKAKAKGRAACCLPSDVVLADAFFPDANTPPTAVDRCDPRRLDGTSTSARIPLQALPGALADCINRDLERARWGVFEFDNSPRHNGVAHTRRAERHGLLTRSSAVVTPVAAVRRSGVWPGK